jgi:hypothetical protein
LYAGITTVTAGAFSVLAETIIPVGHCANFISAYLCVPLRLCG